MKERWHENHKETNENYIILRFDPYRAHPKINCSFSGGFCFEYFFIVAWRQFITQPENDCGNPYKICCLVVQCQCTHTRIGCASHKQT